LAACSVAKWVASTVAPKETRLAAKTVETKANV